LFSGLGAVSEHRDKITISCAVRNLKSATINRQTGVSKMSEKKTFQQWLEDFKKEVEKGYEETTMVTALCEYIHKDCKEAPTTMLKVEREYQNQQMVLLKGTLRNVKPLDAGFVQPLGDWYKNPEGWGMDMFMHELGRDIAEREYAIIVKGMESYAGTTIKAREKGQLSVDDIREAESHAKEYADSVIMNLQQMKAFLIKGQISTLSFLPEEKHGYHYSGMIGGLNVFWTNSIKDLALVFSRREMNFASTPLEIAFEDMESPKQLILHKMCVAAPIFDQAVVKIEL
jgi:hypothetical protein